MYIHTYVQYIRTYMCSVIAYFFVVFRSSLSVHYRRAGNFHEVIFSLYSLIVCICETLTAKFCQISTKVGKTACYNKIL